MKVFILIYMKQLFSIIYFADSYILIKPHSHNFNIISTNRLGLSPSKPNLLDEKLAIEELEGVGWGVGGGVGEVAVLGIKPRDSHMPCH